MKWGERCQCCCKDKLEALIPSDVTRYPEAVDFYGGTEEGEKIKANSANPRELLDMSPGMFSRLTCKRVEQNATL